METRETKRKWARGVLAGLAVLLALAMAMGIASLVHKAQMARDLAPFVGIYRFDSVQDAGASKVGDLVKIDIRGDGLVAKVENQMGDVILKKQSNEVFLVDPPGYQVIFMRGADGKVMGMSPRPHQVKFDFTLTKLEGAELEAAKGRDI